MTDRQVLDRINRIIFNAGRTEALNAAAAKFEKSGKSMWLGERVAVELRELIPPALVKEDHS